MNSQELTAAIFHRLRRFIVIIIVVTVAAAVSLAMYASKKPVTYTSMASIFPLASSGDNNSSSSALSALLGGEASKNFSDDASVNIIELAQSRTTREEIAAIRDSSMGNKNYSGVTCGGHQ